MPKVYLWDTSLISAPGPRFENLIALHLLKLVHYLQDCEGFDVELYYLRDKAGHEVDFLVTSGKKPWFAVEAKLNASGVDPSLVYFRKRLKIPWVYQVVMQGGRDVEDNGVRSLPARQFLGSLV
jgi:predicted AAA+ superfamily ATPase